VIFSITLKKRAIKALEKISEPYYSNIKEAIYSLADNPRPTGYKKLKGRVGYKTKSHLPLFRSYVFIIYPQCSFEAMKILQLNGYNGFVSLSISDKTYFK